MADLTNILIPLIRKLAPNKLAEDLASVQPMTDVPFPKGMSEEELVANGYKPVSHHRLMWIKDDTPPKPKVLKESCTCYRCNVPMVRGQAIDPKWEDTCCHGWGGGPRVQKAADIEMIDVWKCPQCGHSESLYE